MIYATIAPGILVLQLQSITRAFAVVLACAALAGDVVAATAAWRDTPGYLALFTPAPHRADYRAAVSPLGLDDVLRALGADDALIRAPGAWSPRSQLPADAFGRSGTYDRWKLARLYGARQPRVARGARIADGGAIESWTLVSPYPSPDLTRLEPGTLLIVLRIAQ
jgi:hypothetical protein